jgi:glutathione S-transferase
MEKLPLKEPLTIYHIEGSRAVRVVWTCEELGLPYDLRYKRRDLMGSMIQLREVNPLMPMAPTVQYEGKILVESGAILEIIQARHGGGRLAPPLESEDYPCHVQWMYFAESSAMQRFLSSWMVSRALGVTIDKLPPGYRDHRKFGSIDGQDMIGPLGVYDYMEDFLKTHAYFGGTEFTIADIMMHVVINVSKLLCWIYSEDYPHVHAWRQRVESRPAYKRAVAAAVPGGLNEYGLPADAPINPVYVLPPPRNK